jgi:hypothetical protein
MDNDIEINRLEKLEPEPKPKSLTLGQTGCVATLDENGIIHMLNSDGQQLFAVKAEHVPFNAPTLLVTLNLWYMAWSGGRNQMQAELKSKISELVKLCL